MRPARSGRADSEGRLIGGLALCPYCGDDRAVVGEPLSELFDQIALYRERLEPLPPERIEQRKTAIADACRKQTVWTDCAARSLLESLGEQRARELVQMINNIGFGDSGS